MDGLWEPGGLCQGGVSPGVRAFGQGLKAPHPQGVEAVLHGQPQRAATPGDARMSDPGTRCGPAPTSALASASTQRPGMRAAFRSTCPTTPGNRRALSSFLGLSLCPCSVGPKEPGTSRPPVSGWPRTGRRLLRPLPRSGREGRFKGIWGQGHFGPVSSAPGAARGLVALGRLPRSARPTDFPCGQEGRPCVCQENSGPPGLASPTSPRRQPRFPQVPAVHAPGNAAPCSGASQHHRRARHKAEAPRAKRVPVVWVFLAPIPLERQLMKSCYVSTPFLSCPRRSRCCLGNPQCGSAAQGTPVAPPQVSGGGTRRPPTLGSGFLPLERVLRNGAPKPQEYAGNLCSLHGGLQGRP